MIETLDDRPALSFRWTADMGWCLVGMLAALVAGALAGWFEGLFETWNLKLFIIYCIALATACWILVTAFLNNARIRFSVLGLLAALLITASFLVGYEIPGYFHFRQELHERYRIDVKNEGIDPASVDLDAAVSYAIYEETGQAGLLGYGVLRARETALNFFLRILAGAGVAIVSWRYVYKNPYCKACHNFYKGPGVAESIPMEAYERFKALVDSGNLFAAGQMLRDTVPGYPKVMVLVQSCSNPQQHESVIMANRLNFNEKENKVKIQKLMRARINAVQYANFLSGASAPRPELAPSEQPAA